MGVEELDRFGAVQRDIVQIVVEFDVDVLALGRFPKPLHAFAAAVHDHPVAVSLVGDDGIVANGSLLGQDRTVGGLARIDRRHVAGDDVVHNCGRIRTADMHLLQTGNVEKSGSRAHSVMLVTGIGGVTPSHAHAVPIAQIGSQGPVAIGQR